MPEGLLPAAAFADVVPLPEREDPLRIATRHLPAARLTSIGQGLSLMPMTDSLFETVTDGSGALGRHRHNEAWIA
ncbi:hypothetical protein AB0G20_28505 [Streptomyces sp. NPDC024017]|uniref:hypothetical protein n=1 Tax=Streptomyces sp. NPDC024017 TaxID=3154326 RepID=UPI0033EFC778